jgi:nucleotide-binding universal stress UspA family protein
VNFAKKDMQEHFKNILVATDFSPSCKDAIDTAIALCKKHQAALHLMHVVENRYLLPEDKLEVSVPEIRNEIDQASRSQLYNLYELIIRNHNIPVQIHMPTGIPFDEICRAETEIPIDLIVMGKHGLSGSRDSFVGTTTYNVIKNAIKPVLIIPHGFGIRDFKRILFPVRPGQRIFSKYELMESFLKDDPAVFEVAVFKTDEKESPGPYRYEIGKMINAMIGKGISCTKEIYTCPDFAAKVLEIGSSFSADLIVINAGLDYKWSQFFLEPYTQQVVNHANVPVLCFRYAIDIAVKAVEIRDKMSIIGL